MSNRNRNNVTTDETLEAEILASAEEIVEAEDPTTRQKVVAVLKKFAPVAVLTAIGVFVGVGVGRAQAADDHDVPEFDYNHDISEAEKDETSEDSTQG